VSCQRSSQPWKGRNPGHDDERARAKPPEFDFASASPSGAALIGVYIILGVAHQLSTSLVVLVVLRDVMIVGGFLLIQVFAVSKYYDPLYISKLNTGAQVILVGFVLARLGLGASAGCPDLVLSLVVAVTTIVSGLSYLVRWVRILARTEQAL